MKTYNETYVNSNLRAAWTVIELIFVMVIIGILAAIAVKKLSTTRDDAKLSATVSNMHICINDAQNHYMATRKDYTATDHPNSCNEDKTVCYDIIYSINGKDFNVTTDSTGTDSDGITHFYCADIENVGGHLANSYDFGGQSIKR